MSELLVSIFSTDVQLDKHPHPKLDPCIAPYNGQLLPFVPVLNIYGPLVSTGALACVHIHNYFPYVDIPIHSAEIPAQVSELVPHIHSLSRALNAILCDRFRTPGPLVYTSTVVTGTCFYGYHPAESFFLRVFLLDPKHVTALADIIRAGGWQQKPRTPYSAHLSYIMQLLTDHDLLPMDRGSHALNISQSLRRDRAAVPGRPDWIGKRDPNDYLNSLRESPLFRQTRAEVEVDLVLGPKPPAFRELKPLPEDPLTVSGDDLMLPSLATLIPSQESQRATVNRIQTGPDSKVVKCLINRFMTADPSQDLGTVTQLVNHAVVAGMFDASQTDPDTSMDKTVVEPSAQTRRNTSMRRAMGYYAAGDDEESSDFIPSPDVSADALAGGGGGCESDWSASSPDAGLLESVIIAGGGDDDDDGDPRESRLLDLGAGDEADSDSDSDSETEVDSDAYRYDNGLPESQIKRSQPTPPFDAAKITYKIHISDLSDIPRVPVTLAGVRLKFSKAGLPLFSPTKWLGIPTASIPRDIVTNHLMEAHLARRSTEHHLYMLDPGLTSLAMLLNTAASVPFTQNCGSTSHGGRRGAKAGLLRGQLTHESSRVELAALICEGIAQTQGPYPVAKLNPLRAICLVFQQLDAPTSVDRYLLYVGQTVGGGSECFAEEKLMLLRFAQLVARYDPDLVISWDLGKMGFGYISSRCTALGIDLNSICSRNPAMPGVLSGRIAGSIWRLIRFEIKLHAYSLEIVSSKRFNETLPTISHATLSRMLDSGITRDAALRHLNRRVMASLRVCDETEIFTKSARFARIYGVEFESIWTRGSQYRVEGLLIRLCKVARFIQPSPSRMQVRQQSMPESIPLVLEPHSGIYTDPVAVLDFRSLYPSVMVGYNLCYSTCLGRPGAAVQKLGVLPYAVDQEAVKAMISRNGVKTIETGLAFARASERPGVFPRMLSEILATRVAIKQRMKGETDRSVLSRLNNEQMSLKMVANVTYGYTAAGFVGRLPMVDVADAIVEQGRYTLETAMELAESRSLSNGHTPRVIYGDTDSMFVLFPGLTPAEAEDEALALADAVTAVNPRPIKLQYEKVYFPSAIVTKKRYAGLLWAAGELPRFEAKGLEAVRRDYCPLTRSTVESVLTTLFQTNDISQAKHVFSRVVRDLRAGFTPLPDLIIHKEARLGKYADANKVPHAAAALEAATTEGMPAAGERVPYIIADGRGNAKLAQRAVHPTLLMSDWRLAPAVGYYIDKQLVPPLQRVLKLVGVDPSAWASGGRLPVRDTALCPPYHLVGSRAEFFVSATCPLCNVLLEAGFTLCLACSLNRHAAYAGLCHSLRILTLAHQAARRECQRCLGVTDGAESVCTSTECPLAGRRVRLRQEIATLKAAMLAVECVVVDSDDRVVKVAL
ncbi:DNA polymerase zeta catalityc subunit DPOZ [Carpediemonas membranifera]|uniref:DNA polymerase n=1 Tax=Carpediemonas membranifera TaxID=201153 RepID=A0A8J6B950_9EUKA|nr:DNA polymerase zeta catalityc subunit DPOZ [Carpediemonas membranifera]|eukprot:KAG9395759.1 DNA polymerase zeta catalityc subunit DPOZ [Carpediemonas membranifera]